MPWPRVRLRMPTRVTGSLQSAAFGAIGGVTLFGAVLHGGAGVNHSDLPTDRLGTSSQASDGSSRVGATEFRMASAASATDAEPATQRVLTRLGRFFGAEVSSSPGSITPRTTATSAQASATRSTSLQAAEANVARAWEALREIQAEQERLLALPEVVALTRAEQALAQAETRLAQATADVKRLRQPDRVPLEAAERTLWRAEATLRAAHSLRPVNEWSLSPVDRAEEIKQAELAVQDARAKRDAALVGPPVEALAAAEVELTQAQAAQADAAERVQKLRLFVTTIPLEQVKAATASAITDLANAEAQLRSLQLQEARHTQATYGR